VLSASPGNYDGSPVVMYYSLYCAWRPDPTRLSCALPAGWAGPLPPLIYTCRAAGAYTSR